MSCSCGALRPVDCPVLRAELGAWIGQPGAGPGAAHDPAYDVEDPDPPPAPPGPRPTDRKDIPWEEMAKFLWCLLHPIQCKDNPITGPIHRASDMLLLSIFVFAWWKLTDER